MGYCRACYEYIGKRVFSKRYIFILYNETYLVWQLTQRVYDPEAYCKKLIKVYNQDNDYARGDTHYAMSCKYVPLKKWVQALKYRGKDYNENWI